MVSIFWEIENLVNGKSRPKDIYINIYMEEKRERENMERE